MRIDDLEDEMIQARRMAIRRAFVIGVASAGVCFVCGKTFENAAIDGVIVILGGLLAWSTYHLISKRPDGLMMVFLNTLRSGGCQKILGCQPWSLVRLRCWVGLVLGTVNRPLVKEGTSAEFTWRDAEFDAPS